MNKEDLKKKLEEVKAKIKANSKDAHFADSLISDLLSLKGQICVEPTAIRIDESDIVDKFEGETFVMYMTKRGDAVYHVRGGYTIIADTRQIALNRTIANCVSIHKDMDGLTEEQKEAIFLDMSATAYVLNVPMFAFSDQEFKYNMAKSVVKWLRETYEEAMSVDELQPETTDEDKVFEEGVMAVERLKEEISDTIKE